MSLFLNDFYSFGLWQARRWSVVFSAAFLVGLVGIVARAAAEENSSLEILKNVSVTETRVSPPALELNGPRDARSLLVSGRTPDGLWLDLTGVAEISAADDLLQEEGDGYWTPTRNGTSKLLVRAKGHVTEVPVRVTNFEKPAPVGFMRDVMPVLNKAGCTMGTCHGSAKGKNGFKLSLRGYDPLFDYRSLTMDISGRRFNRAEPTQSLMLLKPTQQVPHEGGHVIEEGSRYYKVLHQWISEGVKLNSDDAQRVERIEVLPSDFILPGGEYSQQLIVLAHYADGSRRDVTREAHFSATSINTAEVSKTGLVTALRRGESAIVIRYEGLFTTANLIVFGDRSGYAWVDVPEYNFIDARIHEKLRKVKILPSELCTDEEFLRRSSIDLTGLPPAPEEVRRFLSDPGSSRAKRQKWVDSLLGKPEFVDHWSLKWGDLLRVNRKFVGEKGVWAFQNWIRQAVGSNKPFDQFVRELLTANGSTYENPAANFYRVAREPKQAMETTTQLFLGIRFVCAQCHDHPFEQWTQNNYYQLAAFFGNVGMKRGARPGEEIVYEKREKGEVTHPKGDYPVSPEFPFHYPGERDEGSTPREKLALWLTSPENPYFAQSVVNRVWSYFFGRGIIDPVDDIRKSNPPSNSALLEDLTRHFLKSGFDMRDLIRTIVTSRTYQLGTKTNRWNDDDSINFSHAVPRRLNAEQLLDAIALATETTLRFAGVPRGFRASQTPDPRFDISGFLSLFGRPPRESPCECERRSEVSLSQIISMINGEFLNKAIADPDGRVARLVKSKVKPEVLLEELYLATYTRLPTEEEREMGLKYFRDVQDMEEAGQDILWALINSPAFLFNH